MNSRNLLITCLVTGIIASCSLSPKDPAVPDISGTSRADLIEINASLKTVAPSTDFRPAPSAQTGAEPLVTHRRVEFTIGNETPSSVTRSAADYSDTNVINTSGPRKLAPSYPQRPIPARGMSRDMVVANHGQPANRLAGNGGAEVWDYGTFRVFFQTEKVAFAKPW